MKYLGRLIRLEAGYHQYCDKHYPDVPWAYSGYQELRMWWLASRAFDRNTWEFK
jgi:hypothetical protein